MSETPLLLATKLNPPPARPHLIARARLTVLLDERRPLTLISAPPGFGKTTLLSEWIAEPVNTNMNTSQDHSGVAKLADTPKSPIRYAAVIHDVKEVILTGTADLTFWREALRPQGLVPFSASGSAELIISAPRLAWMGIRFCEWSVSVFVTHREDRGAPDGLFLARAFNSSALLAFAERTFFSTPYFAADIQVEAAVPASISLTQGDRHMFRARMASQPQLLRSGEDLWEGPIFLPRANVQAPRKWFMASLGGDTHTYAFSGGSDVFDLNPTEPGDIFSQLRDSGFTAHEWRLRQRGTHAKSRTLSE